MKLLLPVAMVLFTTICKAQAEKTVSTAIDTKPFIEVIGTAEKEIVPDKIFIKIILTNKMIDKQPYTIETQEDKLKEALQKNKIDTKQLSLSDMNTEIIKYKRKDSQTETKKEMTLLVNTAEQVAFVFKELNALNIKEAMITKLDHSRIDSIRKEVRIAAIKAAKEKAEYLTAAIGETLGKALDIHEQNLNYIDNLKLGINQGLFYSNSTVTGDLETPNDISFEKITITFSYYIKYALKQ